MPRPHPVQLTSSSAGTPVRRRGPLDGPWESLRFCVCLCCREDGDPAPLMGRDAHRGHGLRSRQTQCIFIGPAKSHVPQTSISNPIESLIFVLKNKNLRTPQLWIHFPVILKEDITWTALSRCALPGQESWLPAAHPRNLRATRAEVWSSRARRSCVTDFVSEGCEARAGHQVKCSS